MRQVQCSGKVVLGRWAGERCKRTKGQKPDKNDNTRQWFCAGHIKQKQR